MPFTHSQPHRPEWHETWLDIATIIGKRSLCERDKVGAVIVSVTNRIISTGYNGPPQDFQHENKPCTAWCGRAKHKATSQDAEGAADYSDCPSLHAEANALSVCDRSTREGGTIYVTSHCCISCAKLIANSGLSTVCVAPTSEAKHRNPDYVYAFLEQCGITVYVT